MKKIIATIAAFTMAFALCSCGRSADSEPAAVQPSEVTTAAETAAVTTAPQSKPTTTAKSETTTPENTATSEATTTSESATTTAAKQTADENKPAAVPNKDTPAENKTPSANPTTEPNKPAAKPATTTTKRVWTRELTTEEYWSLDWEEQRDYNQWFLENSWKLQVEEWKPFTDAQKQEYINEVLRLTNAERTAVGLQPLVLDSALCECASIRAEESLKTPYDVHTRPNGESCDTILKEHNINTSYMSENWATGASPASVVVQAWMDSDGHRANILDPHASRIGIGYYQEEPEITYFSDGGVSISYHESVIQIFTDDYTVK